MPRPTDCEMRAPLTTESENRILNILSVGLEIKCSMQTCARLAKPVKWFTLFKPQLMVFKQQLKATTYSSKQEVKHKIVEIIFTCQPDYVQFAAYGRIIFFPKKGPFSMFSITSKIQYLRRHNT